MYDVSYYQQINDEEEEQAQRLGDILSWIYKPTSVLDIGSATGLYLKPFFEKDIKVTGIDYSISAIDESVLKIPRNLIKTLDITKTPIKIKADITLCIEVLEHIDAKFSDKIVRNICSTANTIIFTAAQPGQGGVGHINCQPKQYWIEKFNKIGFEQDLDDEKYILTIMESGYRMGWLINNLMVFKSLN